MFIVFIFILGLIIGSFLNVVILRYGTKDSIVKGSSKCPKCQKDLKWYELVPVLSWILQFGKCRKCGAKISIQYPLIELLTGSLFVLNFIFVKDIFTFILTTIAICLLIIIFVYDLYHKIIPDVFSYSFGILSLIYLFFNFKGWDLIAPIALFLPFYLLWRISNGNWIGLGDGKLAFGFGGFLGLVYGFSAIILSFWIGAVFAIGLMLIDRLRSKSKNITIKSEIAFGPFMIIAFLIVYFLGVDVTGISNYLNAFN